MAAKKCSEMTQMKREVDALNVNFPRIFVLFLDIEFS